MFNSKTEIYCPKCGKPMRLNMALTSLPPQYQYECDNCGYILYSSFVGETTTTTTTNVPHSLCKRGWICPICGTPISPYIDYCPICTKSNLQPIVTCNNNSAQPIVTKWMNTAISSAESSMKEKKG